MKMRVLLVMLLGTLRADSSSPSAISTSDWAILPADQGPKVQSASAFWTPSIAEVLTVEQKLPEYLQANPRGSQILIADYYRQYFGTVSGGHKRIFINCFHKITVLPKKFDWRTEAVSVEGGGDKYWQVEFDPGDATFYNLQFNTIR